MNDVLLFQAVIKKPKIIDSTKFLMVCHRYILNLSTTNQGIFPNSPLAFQ
jgi:hypothetical protein